MVLTHVCQEKYSNSLKATSCGNGFCKMLHMLHKERKFWRARISHLFYTGYKMSPVVFILVVILKKKMKRILEKERLNYHKHKIYLLKKEICRVASSCNCSNKTSPYIWTKGTFMAKIIWEEVTKWKLFEVFQVLLKMFFFFLLTLFGWSPGHKDRCT